MGQLSPFIHFKIDIGSHQADFRAFDECLEGFKQNLPSLERINEETTHSHLIAHSLAHAATVQLHLRFVGQSSTSRNRCLIAANNIVRLTQLLPVRRLPCLNPIMAVRTFEKKIQYSINLSYIVLQVLWTTASEVLSGGLRSLRSTRSAWASSSALPGEDVLLSALAQVTDIAGSFAATSPYMSTCPHVTIECSTHPPNIDTRLSEIRQYRANV